MGDDLNQFKIGIPQQPLIRSSSNFKLRLRGTTQTKKHLNENNLKQKMTSKYQTRKISSNIDQIFLKFETYAYRNKSI